MVANHADNQLRCSREHPVCTRCRRLKAECIYPSPPNRRGRRLRRITPVHRSPGQHIGPPPIEHSPNLYHNDAVGSVHSQTPGPSASRETVLPTADWACSPVNGLDSIHDPSHSYPTQLHRTGSIGRKSVSDCNEPPLPSRAIGLSLLEIYFTRIYNASLLFYKPLLFQKYLDGNLPDILLKSIFALSTLFLSPSNEDDQTSQREHAELKVLSSYRSCGLPWAKSVLREAIPLMVEERSLTVTQALECLQLYWVGVGDTYAGNLCLTMAYRSCNLLGYDRKTTSHVGELDLSLEAELRRRCFWACWTSTCIVAAPEPYVTSAWQEAAKVPLPAFINDTSIGYEIIANEQMNGDWSSEFINPQGPSSSPVPSTLFVKLVGVWSKIQLLVTESVSFTPTENFDKIQTLSNLATSIFDQAKFYRSHTTSGTDKTSEHELIMLSFNALFHLCQITLHSMIVPVFSGKSIDGSTSRDSVRRSAERVVNHARSYTTLLSPYLYAKGDITRVPPLVGYGAFITAMVLLTTEISSRAMTSQAAHPGSHSESGRLSAVEAILGLLDALRKHWRPLQYPVSGLLFHIHRDFSNLMGLQYEKLSTGLQVTRSGNQTHSGTAASESGTVGRRSTRGLGRRPSTQTYHRLPVTVRTDGVVGEECASGAHDSSVQSICPSNGTPLHLAKSPHRTGAAEVSTPPATEDANSDLNNVDGRPADSSFMAPSSDVEDGAWYSLSFAEAGVEQFAGFEPLYLFQHGWRSFS
ncbi:hypothetical protein BJX96DRAFT_163544 [Aspergillus floccosus]